MHRRHLLPGLALALLGAATLAGAPPIAREAALAAKPFVSNRVSVVVKGSGPDVILIPGLTASREVWSGTVAALPGYRYHIVQVSGFAGQPAGANASGAVVEPVAAEIARYIAAAKLRSPAIVGHSMGGTLGMMIASRHPARVGRLMVVDMLPEPAGLLGYSAAGVRPLARSLRNILGGSPGGRRLIEQMMGRYGSGEPGGPKSDSDVVAQATHELALLDLTPELARIKAPLRVVYALPPAGGTTDPARVDRTFRAAYASAKSARLVPIANSGHMIMYDQPAKFRAAMKAFLEG